LVYNTIYYWIYFRKTTVRYGVHSNQFQGDYKRVLTVCSAGILRSATAAHVLCQRPFNFNTRNVGTASYALIPLTDDLILWADEVVCMENEHKNAVYNKMMSMDLYKPTFVLDIEDIYEYRNPKLVKLIKERYKIVTNSPGQE
jgi:predicted protein tyrosine phosphatase